MEAFVFVWVNTITGKRYIGAHKGTMMDGYVCSSKPMMREYKKYPQNFQRTIIDTGTWTDMLAKEQALIAEHNAVKDPMFYNQSCGLGPYHADNTGMKRSPETRAKMSASHIGVKLSEEHKQKMSVANKGKKRAPFSDEWKAKIQGSKKISCKCDYSHYCSKMNTKVFGHSDIRTQG